jgi:hypothetical protein
MEPPTLSHSIIKNLGATFCKIDPQKLSLEELSKLSKPSAPGGKKKARKIVKDSNDVDMPKTIKKEAKK